MNALRNIFNTRTLNYLRQNAGNAFINATQPVDAGATAPTFKSSTENLNAASQSFNPFVVPRSILDVAHFKGKDLAKPNLISTNLRKYRHIERKVELVYLCKLCNTRNSKLVSEAAYTSGVVILQCDGCSINHLIIDHLGWFASKKATGKSFDQVLAENSERIKVIRIDERGELL